VASSLVQLGFGKHEVGGGTQASFACVCIAGSPTAGVNKLRFTHTWDASASCDVTPNTNPESASGKELEYH